MANRYIPFGYEIVDAQVVIIEREAEVCAIPVKIDTKKLQKTK